MGSFTYYVIVVGEEKDFQIWNHCADEKLNGGDALKTGQKRFL
jgi:hypothetical protein